MRALLGACERGQGDRVTRMATSQFKTELEQLARKIIRYTPVEPMHDQHPTSSEIVENHLRGIISEIYQLGLKNGKAEQKLRQFTYPDHEHYGRPDGEGSGGVRRWF